MTTRMQRVARRLRRWWMRVLSLWRRSLQLRTVIVSLALSTVAILLVGIYMSVSISNDLFNTRLNQVLAESQRATSTAQRIFDSSVVTDRAAVQSVMNAARQGIRDASSSSLVAVYRAPGATPNSALAPQDFSSPELSGVISSDLRTSVQNSADQQFWQSVSLPLSTGEVPGVVVGSRLTIPSVGQYELYMGYDFAQAQQTLRFIYGVLFASGLGLLVLIGAIAWFVARMVVTPIRIAAQTSEKIAGGDLDVRLPEEGQDVVATLARSFNHMAESMQGQLTALGTLSVMQQRFVSDVSHELRTPLTTIKLAADVLYNQREEFDPTTRRTAELLNAQVTRFEKMLGDLLEISRYDAGSVDLELQPTNFASLVQDVAGAMTTLAEQHGCDLSVSAPGGHFDAVIDARRVRRILMNLIGNAIEHGERQPIDIVVDSNSTAVAVTVRDYGVGMAAEDLELVFSRFWRADPARQRTLGGTGLGLAISQEDARVHAGRLDVWAAPGEGACFRLTLPRDPRVAMGPSPLPLPETSAEAGDGR